MRIFYFKIRIVRLTGRLQRVALKAPANQRRTCLSVINKYGRIDAPQQHERKQFKRNGKSCSETPWSIHVSNHVIDERCDGLSKSCTGDRAGQNIKDQMRTGDHNRCPPQIPKSA